MRKGTKKFVAILGAVVGIVVVVGGYILGVVGTHDETLGIVFSYYFKEDRPNVEPGKKEIDNYVDELVSAQKLIECEDVTDIDSIKMEREGFYGLFTRISKKQRSQVIKDITSVICEDNNFPLVHSEKWHSHAIMNGKKSVENWVESGKPSMADKYFLENSKEFKREIEITQIETITNLLFRLNFTKYVIRKVDNTDITPWYGMVYYRKEKGEWKVYGVYYHGG